jgi:uncharacterized protein (TIGR02266 family)
MPDIGTIFREYIRLDRKRAGPGLTPDELRRWSEYKRRLGKQFSPDLPDGRSDARRSVRVPVKLRVGFHDLGELRRSLMTNLSRGGLFVAHDEPPDIGTRLELHIEIEASGKQIAVPAEVVSQNVGPGMQTGRRGMGLRFLEMDAATQQQVSALYERELSAAMTKPSRGS